MQYKVVFFSSIIYFVTIIHDVNEYIIFSHVMQMGFIEITTSDGPTMVPVLDGMKNIVTQYSSVFLLKGLPDIAWNVLFVLS